MCCAAAAARCDPFRTDNVVGRLAHGQVVEAEREEGVWVLHDGGGWSIRVDVRQTGGSAGETDLYFFDERGKKFRSRLEVAAPPLQGRVRLCERRLFTPREL